MSLVTVVLGIVVFLLYLFLTKKRGGPLAPGPKGYPIIGVSDSDSITCSER